MEIRHKIIVPHIKNCRSKFCGIPAKPTTVFLDAWGKSVGDVMWTRFICNNPDCSGIIALSMKNYLDDLELHHRGKKVSVKK